MFKLIIRSVFNGFVIGGLILGTLTVFNTSSVQSLFTASGQNEPRDSYYSAIARSAPAVVNIYSTHNEIYQSRYRQQTFERTNLGSGVIMSDKGFLLTCYHVIKDAEQIILGLQDGRFVEARLVGYDAYTDIAVLHTNATDLHVIPQLTEPDSQLGDVVLAIGNPYNLGQTTTKGIISAIGRAGWGNYIGNQNYADFMQTDVVLNDGNSGGALIDSNGVLIGINNANFKTLDDRRQVKDVAGVSFAVPYETAKKVMDSIIQNGRVIRGYLGIDVTQPYSDDKLIVVSVTPRGPAAQAGLFENDVILAVDGQRLSSKTTFINYIAQSMPGNIVILDVLRNNQVIRLEISLGELRS